MQKEAFQEKLVEMAQQFFKENMMMNYMYW